MVGLLVCPTFFSPKVMHTKEKWGQVVLRRRSEVLGPKRHAIFSVPRFLLVIDTRKQEAKNGGPVQLKVVGLGSTEYILQER